MIHVAVVVLVIVAKIIATIVTKVEHSSSIARRFYYCMVQRSSFSKTCNRNSSKSIGIIRQRWRWWNWILGCFACTCIHCCKRTLSQRYTCCCNKRTWKYWCVSYGKRTRRRCNTTINEFVNIEQFRSLLTSCPKLINRIFSVQANLRRDLGGERLWKNHPL